MLTRRAVVLAVIEQVTSTLGAGSTTTVVVLNAGASSVDNYSGYVGNEITISSQTRTIISYNGTSKAATLNLALSSPPSTLTPYSINTYAVDAAPVAANCILCTVPSVKINGAELKRDYVRNTLSQVSHAIGDRDVEITFDTELKGSGTPGTPPEIDPLLQICGLSATTVAGVSVAYVPISDFIPSATVYVYKDGILHKVVGCVADFKLTMPAGQYGMISWTIKGQYAAPVDSALPSIVPNSTLPPIVFSAGVTLSGYSPIAAKLDLELNNTIGKRVDMNNPSGVRGFFVTARDPGGTIDPEMVTIGQKNFWKEFIDSSAQVLSVTISGAPGNVVQITTSGLTTNGPTYEDREGILALSCPFKLFGNDNEFTIKFT